MGVTIQFESRRIELAGTYEMEHDAGVLEILISLRQSHSVRKSQWKTAAYPGFLCRSGN
jgi:hypothetical protein